MARRPRPPALLLLLLACLAASLAPSSTVALFMTVPYNEEQCVRQMVSAGANVVGSYAVETGGYLKLDTTLTTADDEVLYQANKQREGHFQVVVKEHGEITLCFDNVESDRTEKVVEFHLHTEEERLVDDKMAKIEHVDAVNRRLLRLADNIYAFKQTYDIIEVESAVQEAAAESTESRLFWCSTAESIILICMNVWQIRYMLSFFEVKSMI